MKRLTSLMILHTSRRAAAWPSSTSSSDQPPHVISSPVKSPPLPNPPTSGSLIQPKESSSDPASSNHSFVEVASTRFRGFPKARQGSKGAKPGLVQPQTGTNSPASPPQLQVSSFAFPDKAGDTTPTLFPAPAPPHQTSQEPTLTAEGDQAHPPASSTLGLEARI